MKKFGYSLLLLAFVAGFGFSDGMAFSLGGKELVKAGTGARTKSFVGTVYYASLWVPAELKGRDGTAIVEADQPMSIVIVIDTRLLSREKFVEAVKEGFGTSAAAGYTSDKKDAFLAPFNSVEFKKGTVVSLNYVPGKGVSATFKAPDGKAQALGTTPTIQFKKALFAIWLGAKPVQAGLKKGLLGN